ncbi:MAG: protein translocase subunit SecF [Chitinispirillaceae bacterium]|jgi:preprotein translocase subunit SecF|nr:protein translocase subunit SecF [Chitinispirillaceae bacterium]
MIEFMKNTSFDFIRYRAIAISISLAIILGAVIFMFVAHGKPNLSIDFVGGTVVQLKFENPVIGDIGKIRGIISGMGLGNPEIKTVGPVSHNELQITVKKKAEGSLVGDEVKAALQNKYSDNAFELRRQEQVGPKIGAELRTDAIIMVVLSLTALLIYVAFRFSAPFGVAAIIPLFHDVLIALAPFLFFNFEISLSTLAALLTIVGFSINDTIVIFDRVRENLRSGALKKKTLMQIINESINQTLSRTIITSLTVFSVVSFLFFMGGESIRDFSLTMFVGTIAGVYSTIYIAAPILIWWNKRWPITR